MIYFALFTLASLSPVALGHICVMDPPQRVGAGEIQTPGEHVCYLKEGPCGGVESGEPMAQLVGGNNFNVQFQQALNHFYKENPGSLVADFAEVADPTEEDFTPLGTPFADYNALNEITQTNFTMSVVVPNVDCEHCVLRMRYKSNNPSEDDRGMIFYQCSDVSVTKTDEPVASASPTNALKVGAKTETKEVDYSCCAPPLFSVEGYETGSWRAPTQKNFYMDAEKEFLRVDTNSGHGDTTLNGHFQMYNNFTSGIEYYYNVGANTCDLYGLNYWSDWCYGSTNSQALAHTIKMGSAVADVWGMSAQGTQSPFSWTNERDSCIPLGMNRADTGETTVFYNFKEGEFCRKMYELPTVCVEAYEARSLSAPAGDVRASLDMSPRVESHLAHFAPASKA